MVRIQKNELLSRSSAKIFEEIVCSLREEIDEHRVVLNESSNDIHTNFDFLCELDKKIDRLQDRLDKFLSMNGFGNGVSFSIAPLTFREKEVFTTILRLLESFSEVTYAQIASAMSLSTNVAGCYVSKIREKGVPFVKMIRNGKLFVRLDDMFREAQIKKNIVGVDTPLTHWF